MVQVDIFWSYALGAGYAVAASRQLRSMKETASQPRDSEQAGAPFINRYFVFSLFYAAVFFAPSGVYLLWRFTSWETMHVWDRELSPLLVVAFAVTNVTQSALGFWMAWRCIRAGNSYRAFLHLIIAYFCMFFILVHGWDGTGYRRFFSATPEGFLAWKSENVVNWLSSDVAIALYVMGVILIPVLLLVVSVWMKKGYALDSKIEEELEKRSGAGRIMALFLFAIFFCSLGSAIIFSILIHETGWIVGTALFLSLSWLLLLRRRTGLCHRVYKSLTLDYS